MRDIRFRGWDGKEKRMWSWWDLVNTHPLGCLYSHGDGSWEVMQYTGLHDKNGEEIYEGDVLRVTDPYGDLDKSCIVQWDDAGGYTYEPEDGYGDYDVTTIGWAWNFGYRFEVIGNIYEHPHLSSQSLHEQTQSNA